MPMMICYHNQNTFMFSKVNVQRDYSSNPCTSDIYQENQLGAVQWPCYRTGTVRCSLHSIKWNNLVGRSTSPKLLHYTELWCNHGSFLPPLHEKHCDIYRCNVVYVSHKTFSSNWGTIYCNWVNTQGKKFNICICVKRIHFDVSASNIILIIWLQYVSKIHPRCRLKRPTCGIDLEQYMCILGTFSTKIAFNQIIDNILITFSVIIHGFCF